MSSDVEPKVVGQVNDISWQQLVASTKPTAKPASGADEAEKFSFGKVRASGARLLGSNISRSRNGGAPGVKSRSTSSEVNFDIFRVCPEEGLSGRCKRNTLFEMPALELFWGNPNGQFFSTWAAESPAMRAFAGLHGWLATAR